VSPQGRATTNIGPKRLPKGFITGDVVGVDKREGNQWNHRRLFPKRCRVCAIGAWPLRGRSVYPMMAMAISLGVHVRVGIEDTLCGP